MAISRRSREPRGRVETATGDTSSGRGQQNPSRGAAPSQPDPYKAWLCKVVSKKFTALYAGFMDQYSPHVFAYMRQRNRTHMKVYLAVQPNGTGVLVTRDAPGPVVPGGVILHWAFGVRHKPARMSRSVTYHSIKPGGPFDHATVRRCQAVGIPIP